MAGIAAVLVISRAEENQLCVIGRNGIQPVDVPWDTGYEINQAGIVREFGPPCFVPDKNSATAGRAHLLAQAACSMAIDQAMLVRGLNGQNLRSGSFIERPYLHA